MLAVKSLVAGYNQVTALRGIDLTLAKGEIVALLGSNGAGKTTTLRALSGLVQHTGSIRLNEQEISNAGPSKRARLGLAQVPQDRGTFSEFTVLENLRLGAVGLREKQSRERDIEEWLNMFPRLRERARQRAGNLSGGEQQMLAIARVMMMRPRVVMCDEPSLGLAPIVVRQVFDLLVRISHDYGVAVLLVEQSSRMCLEIAHRGYVLENGEVRLSGAAADLRNDSAVRDAYLGNLT